MNDVFAPQPVRLTIVGWPIGHVLVTLVLLAGLVWGAWATRLLLDVSKRQIVSVSLSTLVGDFVAAESRNGGTPEQTAARTAAYLAAVNRSLGALGAEGTIVIVTEATLGKTVPDRTEFVRAEVKRALESGHDAR
jgi:hypothetical protein